MVIIIRLIIVGFIGSFHFQKIDRFDEKKINHPASQQRLKKKVEHRFVGFNLSPITDSFAWKTCCCYHMDKKVPNLKLPHYYAMTIQHWDQVLSSHLWQRSGNGHSHSRLKMEKECNLQIVCLNGCTIILKIVEI